MVSVILTLILSLWTIPAWATIRYIDPTAGACTGNYSIASRNCTGTDGDSFATFALALVPTVGGDTIYYRSGTYTDRMPMGAKTGSDGLYITISAYPGETVTIRPVGDTGEIITANCGTGYHIINGFVFDGVNMGDGTQNISGVVQYNCTLKNHHIVISNNEMKNIPRHVIETLVDHLVIRGNYIHDNVSDCVPGSGRRFYGMYIKAGDDILIENNEITEMAGGYHQVYPGPLTNVVIRNNYFHHNGYCSTTAFGGIIAGNNQGTQYYNNVSVNNYWTGLTISGTTGTPTDTLVRNNIFYGNATYGLQVSSVSTSPLRTILENNLVVGNMSSNISVSASATTTVQTTNRSTGSITDCTVSTSDFTHKSGSSCIDAGTIRSGFNYNGSSSEIGVYESVPNPVCSITTNVITCIFPMSLNVPIQGLSTTGVTVGCTGSACPGSPTASAVNKSVGTDTHVDITVAGITGNACVVANQTWTLTYNSATGAWTDNANIGIAPGIHQKIFSFTSLAVTNQCTGAAAGGYPAGYHIYYKFDENTGTNANDESVNNLDCTFTNTPTWGPGKTGSAMVVAAGGTAHCAIPWGSGVNPYSADLTIVAPVLIADGTTNATHFVVGPSHGTNQRFYICSYLGTWRISYQAVACEATASSNLAVTNGWNHLTLRTNGTTHVATLHKNGVAGSGGASVTLTSYTLASNITLGRVASVTTTGGSYDDFLVYLSLEDPVAIYEAFQAVATPAAGTLAQAAVQAQGVYLDSTGAVRSFGALNSAIETVASGGVALVFQVHCQAGADCDPTAFRLVYSKNQTAAAAASAGTLLQVPNTETADGIWMWYYITGAGMNTGSTTTRLTGSCTVTTGSTQITADQIPSVDLPDDGCVMLRYTVRVSAAVGDFFELRLLTEAGLALDGGYVSDARVTVVNPRASGVGF